MSVGREKGVKISSNLRTEFKGSALEETCVSSRRVNSQSLAEDREPVFGSLIGRSNLDLARTLTLALQASETRLAFIDT